MSVDFSNFMQGVRADKAKWATMCLFMALGLLLWGRLLLKDVPRVVTATDELTGGEAEVDRGDVSTDAKAGRADVELVVPPRIDRDIFAMNPRYFEAIDADTEKAPTQAKSGQVTVDDGNGTGQRVGREAERLTLQSTLLGDSPRALVNNRLLEVGEAIEGFTLLEVGVRQARLQKDGVIVVLKMKTP